MCTENHHVLLRIPTKIVTPRIILYSPEQQPDGSLLHAAEQLAMLKHSKMVLEVAGRAELRQVARLY